MRWLAPLLVAILATSCAGSPQASTFESVGSAVDAPLASAGASPTLTPSPSPSPTPFDIAATADGYLAIVEALNATACAQNPAILSGDLATAQAGWAIVADADRVFADGLRQVEFPPELASAKEDMLRASAASEQSARALAAAATMEQYNAIIVQNDSTQREASSLSNYIRGELGLASTPGSC